MRTRRARPEEAEALWRIRNLAIRGGCREAYGDAAVAAWTPDKMPPGFVSAIVQNPFFVTDAPDQAIPVATGFLDLQAHSVEAIFTLPDYMGFGYATAILQAIKQEALARGFTTLTLASTPNAWRFYQHQGFRLVKKAVYHSAMAGELACMKMVIDLPE
ncbi:GNAT family N-acetyltransferase [Pantoea sp. MBD-2R]|uniref:GNAT family N-acetyltransferase n=1 Tax=unclassified Pantoea TaxID=2630326 RepID=UPI0011BF1F61|nr:GNAT family N-acetyltransferase [Pantoea sp. CCBC3-3-1]